MFQVDVITYIIKLQFLPQKDITSVHKFAINVNGFAMWFSISRWLVFIDESYIAAIQMLGKEDRDVAR